MPLLPVRIYLRFPMHERLATNPLPRYILILGDLPPIRPIPLWPILHKVFVARRLLVREIRQDNHRRMVRSPPLPSHDFSASTSIHVNEVRVVVAEGWTLLSQTYQIGNVVEDARTPVLRCALVVYRVDLLLSDQAVVSRPRIGCQPGRASRTSSMKRQGVASEASQGVTSEAMGRGQQTRVSIRSI